MVFYNVKVLIADDHSVVRQGVSLILREAFSNMEVALADSFEKAMEALKANPVDLLLLDINLPGGNSVSMVSDIYAVRPTIKILMFSAYDEEQYAIRYIHAGVHGYLNKLSSEEEIIEAVQTILNDGKYISPKVKEKIFENALNKTPDNPLDTLSNRELEIAEMLVQGEGNLEIANKLDIRMSTVSTYKSRIFEKLGVSNIVSLVEKFRLHSS